MLTMSEIIKNNNTNLDLLQIKELELNALVDITQSINNNVEEDKLYAIYNFTLKGSLHVKKSALFVFDKEEWQRKTISDAKILFTPDKLELKVLQNITETTHLNSLNLKDNIYKEFTWVVPIQYKDKRLAYLFLYTDSFITEESPLHQSIVRFVETLTSIVIVALENKKLIKEQVGQAALKKEMEIAKQVQTLLFPKHLPYEKHLKIKATYFPHALIGGDYYDYIPLKDDKFILCIADVSGKGIPAALLMSNFQASLRTLVRQTQDLKKIIEELNYQIYQNALGEHFITFFIGLYDRKNKNLSYINAGHNPAFLLNITKKESILLDKGTTILGIFHPLPFLEENSIEDLSDFYLFNYTDGVTEVNNPEGEQFGAERLFKFIESMQTVEPPEIHSHLVSKINLFKKNIPFPDDITMLSCKVESQK